MAAAGTVSFGTLSISDNNGGSFLTSLSTSSSGNAYTIDLGTAFEQSNFASFGGEVSFDLAAASTAPDIVGMLITYTANLVDGGSVSFTEMINASTTASGSFGTSPYSSGLLSFAPTSGFNIGGLLTLSDNGGIAGVQSVRIELMLPEPSSVALVLLGFAGVAGSRRLRSQGPG